MPHALKRASDSPSPLLLVRASLVAAADDLLADVLLTEFDELMKRFHLRDFRPSELSGGRFAEAAFRVCQRAAVGKYTAIGRQLPRTDILLRDLESAASDTCDDTFRIHIPRALRLLYDLRSTRDVAHLGNGVSPNFTDSSLTIAVSAWVMSEFVRVFHQCDSIIAQQIVDTLMQRQLPLIWTRGNAVRVLDPELDYWEKALLILYHFQPELVSDEQLFKWLEYANRTEFKRDFLTNLHKKAFLHYENGFISILPPGQKIVEDQIVSKTAA